MNDRQKQAAEALKAAWNMATVAYYEGVCEETGERIINWKETLRLERLAEEAIEDAKREVQDADMEADYLAYLAPIKHDECLYPCAVCGAARCGH
jgi:hypothetical protein